MLKTRRYRLLLAGGVLLVIVAGLLLGPLRKPALYVWNAECFGWSTSDRGVRIAALGDSIAEGNSAVGWGIHGDTSWYSHLVCGADARGADGINAGRRGQTTAQIRARIDEVLDAEPQVLVVGGGTNDQARGVPLEQTMDNLRFILDKARDIETVVLTTVPRSRSATDDRLDTAIRILAAERGIPLVDFASTLTRPGATFDGIHPTADSARIMADQVADAAGLRVRIASSE
ncbi:SGNH/GDSL hydrolase family protein [Rhodococcoides fascians]|uniref:SGNH/GDSL hydrolase family protein n=1 Tax=Rhodococcoides fascians TaxID=1828 RepID=UPI0005672C7B|nr:GDSL-type esterase/lipase family protein [Rhodococcus fascians]